MDEVSNEQPPVSQDRRVLVVNADDFGLSPGVNAGVMRAHEQGILTSASLMVRGAAAADAAAHAAHAGRLGLGLHVDLGEWVRRGDDWETVYEVVPMDDVYSVELELRAQIDSFRRLVGRDPTHLDSHQHVHNWHPVVALFKRAAAELGVPLRHHTRDVTYCGDLYGHDSNGNPIPEAITVENLVEIIADLRPGVTELACHPGIGDDSGSAYDRERAQEVAILCDPRVREAVTREGVALRSFAHIARAEPSAVKVPAAMDDHRGFTLWLTGLPRSGKSTVAGLVAGRLRALGAQRIEVLDGDIVREGLCKDLGFSRADRTENIRRIAFVSKLLTRNGVAVIVAAISPYREDRELAREEIQSFVEVWCRASVDACASRDYKGLYEKARRGEIDNLTGVNDPYEEPEDADLVLDTENDSPEQSAEQVMTLLRERGFVPAS
jgi:adenylyl-sulfate kinase